MKHLLTLSAFLMTIIFADAQSADSVAQKLKMLSGEWTASGSGSPGQGTGSFSFKYDLDNKIMVRKNISDYPAAGGKPAVSHSDLMVIYNPAGTAWKAVYFDNEGHTINYSLSPVPDGLDFISEPQANSPQFRLHYQFLENGRLRIDFAIADPKTGSFKTYVSGEAERSR